MTYLQRQRDKKEFLSTYLLLSIPFFSFAFGAVVGLDYISEHHIVSFLIGCMLSISTFYLISWRDKFEKEMCDYRKGIAGEDFVERFMDSKKAYQNFKFVRNIKIQGGNADFVVINDRGVFCLEVKNVAGNVTYDGTLRINGYVPRKNYINQAKGAAAEISNIIFQKSSRKIYVNPVIVFSSQKAMVNIKEQPKGLQVTSIQGLMSAINKSTCVMPKEMQEDIFCLLNNQRKG